MATIWRGQGPGDTIGYCSLAVYNVLKRHAMIADFYRYNGNRMFASPELLSDYFGMDELVIGRAQKDTANIGKAEANARIWPNVFGIIRRAMRPTLRNASFGYRVMSEPIRADVLFDEKKGLKGAYICRAGTCLALQVLAADCGHLITTPIG
jgi:hypothetical protein